MDNFDAYFDLAETGGKLKAIHAIFIILQNEEDPNVIAEKLKAYQEETVAIFKKQQLNFKMQVANAKKGK